MIGEGEIYEMLVHERESSQPLSENSLDFLRDFFPLFFPNDRILLYLLLPS